MRIKYAEFNERIFQQFIISLCLQNLISNKILPLQFVQTLNKSWMKRHRYWFANGPKNFCKSSSHLWGNWHFIWLTKCLWTISHLQLILCFLPWLNLEMVSSNLYKQLKNRKLNEFLYSNLKLTEFRMRGFVFWETQTRYNLKYSKCTRQKSSAN